MNMSNPGGAPAGISPDEWERIARYVTGEAGPGEIEITMRWVEADTHRAEVVRLLQSIVRNVERDEAPATPVDVEGALARVKARFGEGTVIPLQRSDDTASRRTTMALLKIAAAALIIIGGTALWQNLRRAETEAIGQTFGTTVGERRE